MGNIGLNEKIIIQSSESVRSIIDGTKNIIVKVVRPIREYELIKHCHGNIWADESGKFIKCAYGKKNDLIFVKEMFSKVNDEVLYYDSNQKIKNVHWHQAQYMPKELCRIRLRVNEIITKRLFDLTDDEIKMEASSIEYKNYKEIFFKKWYRNNLFVTAIVNPWVWVIKISQEV